MDKSTILIVDDNKMNIDLLHLILEKNYNVRIARNGEECLKRSLIRPYPDLILLDIMMPVMDGYETIKLLKADEITNQIPVIFLTALSEKEELVKGLELGAVDYITKPFNSTELQARLRTHLDLKESREKTERLNIALEERLAEQRMYIEKARQLQHSLIQKELPLLDEYLVHALYMPSESLGGDFFTLVRGVYEKKLVIVIGDCTGHGVEASIDSSLLTRIVQKNMDLLFSKEGTSVFLDRVNLDYMEIADEDKFPTLFVGVLDMRNMRFLYSNANGVLPSLIRDSRIRQLAPAGGMHIGYSTETVFQNEVLDLEDGDRLYFFSDAVLEHTAVRMEHSGRDKVEKLLVRQHRTPTSDFIETISDLEKAAGGFPLEDDATLIQIDVEKLCKRDFSFNTLNEYNDLLDNIREILIKKDFNEDEISGICIGLDEMCLNAYYHGNEENPENAVQIEAIISFKSVTFTITDMGEGFDLSAVPDPVAEIADIYEKGEPDEYTHGRGIEVVRRLYDSVDYNTKCNSVTITKSKNTRNVTFPDNL